MNEATKQRLAIAQKMASTYSANPKVRAVGLHGSVARRQADKYSDIEISVFYEEFPWEEERLFAYQQNQGSDYRIYSDERETGALVEQYFVEGVKCDVGHVLSDRVESDLTEAIEKCDPSDPLQYMLAGFVEVLPLFGEELIEKWKAKVENYPPQLAQAMVKKHLRFRPLWVLQNLGVKRDDVLFFYEQLLESVKNILGVLLGLNGFYHPVNFAPFKNMDKKFIQKMSIAPDNFSFRLNQLLREDPQVAVTYLGELIEETFALVQKYMPEVETTDAWQHYKHWQDKFGCNE